MEITDVRIKLVNNSTDRLKAFCSVTLDDEFVIRDIKLVEGASGLFVAMPSRKLSASCPECHHKNPLRAHFCNECGADLPRLELPVDDHGRLRLYRDIAHPITPDFREKMQELIVGAYEGEQERSVEPDYEPATGVDLDDLVEDVEDADDTSGNRREESSEYAALIAGLDRGSQSQSDRSPGRRQDRGGRTPDSRVGRQRGETTDSRERRGDARGEQPRQERTDRADRGERRDDTRDGQRRRGGRRRKPNEERRDGVTAPRTAPAALVSTKDVNTEKPMFDKAEVPRKEHTATKPREESDKVSLSSATKDTSATESPDDTAAFGAGIL